MQIYENILIAIVFLFKMLKNIRYAQRMQKIEGVPEFWYTLNNVMKLFAVFCQAYTMP